MALCLSTAVAAAVVAAEAFTLGWTHSIEKVRWEEDWQVAGNELVLAAVRVRGHAAGMEPGEGAVLRDGAWEWYPRSTHAELRLTRSEHTADYTWCSANRACEPMARLLPSDGGVTRVHVCPKD